MEVKKFLPLGSIVLVKGGLKKLMILARAVYVDVDGKQQYFDYGSCTYPEGVVGAEKFYFAHGDIQEVVFKGFEDADEERMQKMIAEGLERMQKQENKQ